MSSKEDLRIQMQQKLQVLENNKKSFKDSAINQSLLEYVNTDKPERILSFKPIHQEPDISEFNNTISKSFDVYYPDMKEICIYNLNNEKINSFKNLNIIIIPAIALTRDGIRLGRGGGWYDRLLEHTSATRISVVYDLQLVNYLPKLEHDQQIDIIITEFETFKCNN